MSTDTPSPLPGLAVAICGPSGVGKSTIVRGLLDRHPGEYVLSVSATTRPPREGEVDGRDYRFLDEPAFLATVERGEFLEHAVYNGNRYGTPRAEVARPLEAGHVVLLDIDVQGADQIRATGGLPVLYLFIVPPSEGELKRRLQERHTDSPEAQARRLEAAQRELAQRNRFDHEIVNDTLSRAIDETDRLIHAARAERAASR